MKKYHKIQSIFKREKEPPRNFIIGDYSRSEFLFLKDNLWDYREKVNGTCVRVIYDPYIGVEFRGKTDNAQLPTKLVTALIKMFTREKLESTFTAPVCLYGEGYGPGIEGGGKYRTDPSFVLFDIKIDEWWLTTGNCLDLSYKLGIDFVPWIGQGTLEEAVTYVKEGFNSKWGEFPAEGLVLKPVTQLFARDGSRIITKIKHKDFKID